MAGRKPDLTISDIENTVADILDIEQALSILFLRAHIPDDYAELELIRAACNRMRKRMHERRLEAQHRHREDLHYGGLCTCQAND
jgi:hypothetical protein